MLSSTYIWHFSTDPDPPMLWSVNEQTCHLFLYLNATFSVGWQWNANDRPSFADICFQLEHMFEHKTIDEGKSLFK